jgi:gamma-glutamylcysteine synthetase
MRRLFLALALLAAGCGAGEADRPDDGGLSSKTMPVSEYVARADDICRESATRALNLQKEIRDADSTNEMADALEKELRNLREMRKDLEALGVPKGEADVAKELVAGIRDAEPHLERVIAAMRDGDGDAAEEAGQRYREASTESARQVQRSGLDFEVCGSAA